MNMDPSPLEDQNYKNMVVQNRKVRIKIRGIASNPSHRKAKEAILYR